MRNKLNAPTNQAEMEWMYRSRGVIHGPFSSSKMAQWLKDGRFDFGEEKAFRRREETQFYSLTELIAIYGDAPFGRTKPLSEHSLSATAPTVPAISKPSPSNHQPETLWTYRFTTVRGEYTSSQMAKWLKEGYFTNEHEKMFMRKEDNRFYSLAELQALYGDDPFVGVKAKETPIDEGLEVIGRDSLAREPHQPQVIMPLTVGKESSTAVGRFDVIEAALKESDRQTKETLAGLIIQLNRMETNQEHLRCKLDAIEASINRQISPTPLYRASIPIAARPYGHHLAHRQGRSGNGWMAPTAHSSLLPHRVGPERRGHRDSGRGWTTLSHPSPPIVVEQRRVQNGHQLYRVPPPPPGLSTTSHHHLANGSGFTRVETVESTRYSRFGGQNLVGFAQPEQEVHQPLAINNRGGWTRRGDGYFTPSPPTSADADDEKEEEEWQAMKEMLANQDLNASEGPQ